MTTRLDEITKLLDGLQSSLNESMGNSFKEAFVFISWDGRRPKSGDLKTMLSAYGMNVDKVYQSFHRSPAGRNDIILVSTPGSTKRLNGWKWYKAEGLTGEESLYRFNESLNRHYADWKNQPPTD